MRLFPARTLWAAAVLIGSGCGSSSKDAAPVDTSAAPDSDTDTGSQDTESPDTSSPDSDTDTDTGTPPAALECVVQDGGCDRILLANDDKQLLLQGSGYWADDGLDHSGETVCVPSGEYTVR